MDDSDTIEHPENNDGNIDDHQSDQSKRKNLFLSLKLILFGLLLPVFDVGTDLMTIYQSLTSHQWILNYLAVSLIFSLIGHNMASALYGWKNWSVISATQTSMGMTASLSWRVGRVICYGLGIGNIPTTIELILDLIFQDNIDER